jgi:hypothetical protein
MATKISKPGKPAGTKAKSASHGPHKGLAQPKKRPLASRPTKHTERGNA